MGGNHREDRCRSTRRGARPTRRRRAGRRGRRGVRTACWALRDRPRGGTSSGSSAPDDGAPEAGPTGPSRAWVAFRIGWGERRTCSPRARRRYGRHFGRHGFGGRRGRVWCDDDADAASASRARSQVTERSAERTGPKGQGVSDECRGTDRACVLVRSRCH